MKKTARGLTRRRGRLNKTERDYETILMARRAAGEILWYRFEGLAFRLATGAYYRPDFVVQLADGTIECHEVKGHWREAARVRIKVAANNFPFRFVAVKRKGKGWEVEEISG